ncbi:hypothetical protein [Oharaeibacter diazotrophicus]|uniref:Uncharacterized protein n=1 Tax=Oharaeibacter diazotrophicus TaxID=1920512 RepID=A0A4R6RJD3_9HYPH|nr:hypothetical protein [Oharaeibacter diazotrophicus]TDP86524.1 hypothetical protein EDD54_0401 [Oharaeibacter diazotrophicus]BBE71534.1 hypothetical protein OHA_1_01110 [Pleomorphomonas sp. SM30]GLS78295.1 hypothetical protein GCM10007904_36320 [Oharaeibacter diazotrophicus]
MKSAVLAAVLASTAAALVPGLAPDRAAAAEVRTQYLGAACQGLSGADPLVRDVAGRIRNAGTAPVIVVCPVVRDVTASTSLEFAALTLGGSVTSSCSVVVVNAFGNGSGTSPSAIRPVAGTEHFRVQFADGAVNIQAPAESNVMFKCTLAPGGSILNLAVVENVAEN